MSESPLLPWEELPPEIPRVRPAVIVQERSDRCIPLVNGMLALKGGTSLDRSVTGVPRLETHAIVREVTLSNGVRIGVFAEPVRIQPQSEKSQDVFLCGYVASVANEYSYALAYKGALAPALTEITQHAIDGSAVSIGFVHSSWHLPLRCSSDVRGVRKNYELLELDRVSAGAIVTTESTFVVRDLVRRWSTSNSTRVGRRIVPGRRWHTVTRRALTNGEFCLPWDRPTKRQEVLNAWPEAGAAGLWNFNASQWERLREIFRGAFYSDLGFDVAEDKSSLVKLLKARIAGDAQRRSVLVRREAVFLEMFVGTLIEHPANRRVGRLLYELPSRSPERKAVYVVDLNPVRDAACYIFTDGAAAFRWATGELRFEKLVADKSFHRRIVHAGEWQRNVEQALLELEVFPDRERALAILQEQ